MACDHDCMAEPPKASRRGFLTRVALGGGAALLSSLPLTAARAAGHVDVLLLSCMDYRLMDEVAAYMQGRGLKDAYDHVILAGASLGALTTRRPDWGRTFFEHLAVAIQLHHVKKVMVLDHRDCGAYRVFMGADAVKTPEAETAVHARYLKLLRTQIRKRHPELEVELGLMALDGTVETIS